MKKSPTHMATPGAGGRFRELPDGTFEEVPEDAELVAPKAAAKKPKAATKAAPKQELLKPAPPLPKSEPAAAKAPAPAKAPVPLTDNKETAHD